jgi:hypothetical protein
VIVKKLVGSTSSPQVTSRSSATVTFGVASTEVLEVSSEELLANSLEEAAEEEESEEVPVDDWLPQPDKAIVPETNKVKRETYGRFLIRFFINKYLGAE